MRTHPGRGASAPSPTGRSDLSAFPALLRRVSVAVPGIGAFIAVALLNIPSLTVGFFSLIAGLCGYEAIALLDTRASSAIRWTAVVLSAGGTAVVALFPPGLALPLVLAPGVITGLWWVATGTIEDASGRIAGSTGLLAAVCIAFGLLARMRLDLPSAWVMLLPLLVVWAGDSAAYFIGSAFGRHRMAPHVSPAKSWEGFTAGMAASMGAAALAGAVGAGLPLAWMLTAGAAAGAAGTLGDLYESALKRNAGVKDSGSLLPGHGGLLDRFDSLLGAVPATWVVLQLMFRSQAGAL